MIAIQLDFQIVFQECLGEKKTIEKLLKTWKRGYNKPFYFMNTPYVPMFARILKDAVFCFL